MIIAEFLAQALRGFDNSDIARFDIELLLAHVLKKNRSYLFAHPEYVLSHDQAEQFAELLACYAKGEPIAYLFGEKEFWSLSFYVTPDTLIPRPETELLVEQVLTILPKEKIQYIADLGTGSGAIACAIASERPHWDITATDISVKALEVAQRNAERHGLSHIHFLQGAWCEVLPHTQYDAILSNPPYIDKDDPHLSQGGLDFEPSSALISSEHGLKDLQDIILQARSYLRMGGWLLLEHGYSQGETVRNLMDMAGYRDIKTHVDLAGCDRVSVGCCAI